MTSPDTSWIVDALYTRAKECKKCPLHETRISVVFGAGNVLSPVYVLGEAPGEMEDENGVPFIGRSGALLRKLLVALGFDLGKIFITNTIMCRPPKNRDPSSEELRACSDWLSSKLGLAEPKVVIAVGKYALGRMLGIPTENIQRQVKITSIVRDKKVFNSKKFGEVSLPQFTVVPTVHPSYVLRGGCSEEDLLSQLGIAASIAEKLKLDVFE